MLKYSSKQGAEYFCYLQMQIIPAGIPQQFIRAESNRRRVKGSHYFKGEICTDADSVQAYRPHAYTLRKGMIINMRFLTGIYWNRGSAAPDNQDSVVLQQVLTARGRVLLAAVCDGMGGLEQGEWVSGYVTKRLQEWFYEFLLRAVQRRKPCWVIRRSMDRLVYHMYERIRQYSRQEKISLGTTMTVLVIVEKTYFIWHLGDSRAYWIYDGHKQTKVMCMTHDHVKGRNMLTKCVGSFGYEKPDFTTGSIRCGQAVLLCSDGFYHCVTQQELAAALDPVRLQEEEQIARRLREIGEVCMRRGERDNLSAVYVKAAGK